MRVHHLAAGMTRPPGGAVRAPAPLPWQAPLPCHVLAIESGDGLILVDTGVRGAAVAQLSALGFDPADVRHVVLTRLEHDHAGGLVDFPGAAVHLLAAEHAAAARRGALSSRRYRPAQWAHEPRWQLHAPRGERWFGFTCSRDALPDGVVLVPLPGPTRGHAGVAVASEDGWLLHAGDAYLTRAEVHGSAPSCPATLALARQLLDDDPGARAATRERLRVLAADPDRTVLVFSAHDPAEMELCLERNPPAPSQLPVLPPRRAAHLQLVAPA